MTRDAALRRILERLPALTEREAQNLARDLTAVEQRLASGEYAETDFVARSVFEVQRRTHEFVTYMRGWHAQGQRWSQLLTALGVPDDVVIDLCPGWAPKIELALMQAGFRGRVVAIDRSEESLTMLQEFLAVLQPSFTVVPVVEDVMGAPERPSHTARLVVANHVVDDLLVDRWVRARGGSLAAIYDDERLLAEAWRGVLRDAPQLLPAFPRDAAHALARYVADGGTLVVSHYSSLIERLIGGDDVAPFFADAFARVCAALVNDGVVARALPVGVDGFDDARAAVFVRPAR